MNMPILAGHPLRVFAYLATCHIAYAGKANAMRSPSGMRLADMSEI